MRKSNFNIRFDRNEFAGSFGDIGTDFPLIVGIILAAGLDPTSALVMFGVLQILTGLVYGLPMPVQPLKAMAVIVISQKLSGNILFGGGLMIGLMMLVFSLTGLLNWVARVVPKCVIRGIQFGLGAQLAILALKEYVQVDGVSGYILAVICFLFVVLLLGNRKVPASLLIIGLGLLYAFVFKLSLGTMKSGFGWSLPQVHVPTVDDVWAGFFLLALPQIALSIGNSVLATQQVADDFFKKKITVRKIGITYSLMNLIAPFLSGIPVCHGAGGMAGHYTFGARTGGAVIIYGSLYLILGLFFGAGFKDIIQIFPKPMLGILLFFEGIALMRLMKDTADDPKRFMIVLLVGLAAIGLPNGYLVGLVAGTLLAYAVEKKFVRLGEQGKN